jgi:hypothetical protein
MAIKYSPIVGVFDERSGADNAIEQLHSAGFNDDQICYSGNVSSGAAGGFLEIIKKFFTGNQTTSSSDVAHVLTDIGLSDDEANYYGREYEAGRSIVAVNPGERYEEALTILRSNGAHGYQPGTSYSQGGMATPTGYDQTSAGAAPDNPQQSDYAQQPDYDQIAGYSQHPSQDQIANAPSYNQQAAEAGYNPRSAAYDEQPMNYGPESANPVADEVRRRRLREERRDVGDTRDNTVTDADINP